MNLKNLIVPFLIFTIFGCNGKKEKVENQELNKFPKEIQSFYNFLIKDTDYAYQTIEFNEKDYFEPNFTEEKIKSFISKIKKNQEIEIESEFNKIVLNLSFDSPKTNKDLAFSDLKIKLKSSEIFDRDNKHIKLNQGGNINFNKNKISYSLKVKNDSVKANFYNKFSGNLIYSFKFLIGYDIIKLSKNNIGELFTLNNCKFKLINIFNNKIFVENLCKSDISSKVINLTKKGKMVKQYPMIEFIELKKNNESFIGKENFEDVIRTKFMSKKILEGIEKNPNITISEFNEIVLKEKKKSMIKIFNTISNSETEIILYSPIYQTELIEFKK